MTEVPGPASPGVAEMRAREVQLERFEQAWQAAADAPPSIAAFLAATSTASPAGIDRELFVELLKTDLEYRWRSAAAKACRLKLEDYVSQCPAELREDFPSVELIAEEYRVRRQWGDQPSHEHYAARFPGLGSTLAEALQRVDRELSAEVAASRSMDDTVEAKREVASSFTPPSMPRLPSIPGYEIRGVLGVGGMAVVYDAWQSKLNRRVALKMIRTGLQASEQELARFHQEAQAIAVLEHPNVVRIFDVGQHEGQPYCAMELVTRGSLADALDGTPLAAREAARFVRRLTDAVHAAHRAGIIHRDLKPANVLLAARDKTEEEDRQQHGEPSVLACEPKVADFGLAKRLDALASHTQTGELLGTPSYMAPEQAEGRVAQVGPATDVYALGAILYELLTGRPPFRAATTLETLQQVRLDEPLAPRRLLPKLPRDLDTICLRCLEKDPHKRYGSAEQLADDLGRYLRGEAILARPVGWLELAAKWAKRHPARAALLMVAALSAASLFGLTLRHNRQLRAEIARADAGEAAAKHQTTLALENVDRANETLRALLERIHSETRDHDNPQQRRLQADLLRSMLSYYETALAGTDERDDRVGLAAAMMSLYHGQLYHYLEEPHEAESYFEQARAQLERLVTRHVDDEQYLYALALCNYRWAQTCRVRSDPQRDDAGHCQRLLQRTLEELQPVTSASPRVTRLRARANYDLADSYMERGETVQALAATEHAVWLFEQLFGEQPTEEHRRHLGEALRLLTYLYASRGDRDLAAATTARCAELVQPWLDAPPPSGPALSSLNSLAECWRGLSLTAFATRDYERGLAETARGFEVVDRVLAIDPQFLPGRETRHGLHWSRAALLDGAGRMPEALQELGQAIAYGRGLTANAARLQRALYLLKASQPEAAAMAAHELAARDDLRADQRFDLAILFCRCAQAAGSADAPETAAELTRCALESLQRCHASGYFEQPAHRERLRTEPALAMLREDVSCHRWLQEVANKK